MKKLISTVLTSAMMLSMTATAFAAEPLKYEARGNGEAIKTYSVQELQQDPSVTFETDDKAVMLKSAYDTVYLITIDISCKSSLIGAERDYYQNNFTCAVSNNVLNTSSSGTLRVEVGTKKYMDIAVLAYDTLTFTGDNQNKIAELGNVGAGKRVFKFKTGNAGITADVMMRSW